MSFTNSVYAKACAAVQYGRYIPHVLVAWHAFMEYMLPHMVAWLYPMLLCVWETTTSWWGKCVGVISTMSEMNLVIVCCTVFGAVVVIFAVSRESPKPEELYDATEGDADYACMVQQCAMDVEEEVRAKCLKVSKWLTHDDEELGVQCEYCRGVVSLMVEPVLFEGMLANIDKCSEGLVCPKHACPVLRQPGSNLSLITKLMALYHGQLVAAFARSLLPEGRMKGANSSKAKNKGPSKRYVAGGKFVGGKQRFSEENYGNFLEDLQDGNLERAFDRWAESEMDAGEDAGGGGTARVAARMRQNFIRIAQQNGVYTPEFQRAMDRQANNFYETTSGDMSGHGRYHQPEGVPCVHVLPEGVTVQKQVAASHASVQTVAEAQPMKPVTRSFGIQTSDQPTARRAFGVQVTGVQVAMVPEGKKPPVLAVGEHWTEFCTEKDRAAVIAEAKALQERHGVVYRQAVTEMTRVENKPPPVPEAIVTVSQQPKKGRGPRNKKHLPEGAVQSSTAFCIDDRVAAATFADGRVMQGYLTRKEGGVTWFVTGRHKLEGGAVIDGFPEGGDTGLTLHRPGQEDQVTAFIEKRCSGGDRVALRLNVQGKVVTPQVRAAVCNSTVLSKYYDPVKRTWDVVFGNVMSVTPKFVGYKFSTKPGCCRMAVFDQQGYLVAGHYYPAVSTAHGTFPGGEPEPTSIPPGWEPEYRPPPMVPQGAEVAALGLQSYRGPFQRVEKMKISPLRTDMDLTGYRAAYFMAKPSTDMLKKEVMRFMTPPKVSLDSELLQKAVVAYIALDGDGRHKVTMDKTLEDVELVVRDMNNDRTNAGSDAVGQSHEAYLTDVGEGDLEEGIRRVSAHALHLLKVIDGKALADEADLDTLESCRVWCVQGKRDGYKEKKLFVGRSVQAPCFTFKLLYRLIFKEADTHWASRNFTFRTGANMDKPVSDDLVDIFQNALASLGMDMSAFDRDVLREFLRAYFMVVVPAMCPGVSQSFVKFLFGCTADSYLLLTDGSVYLKDRGNPSGFPNTLRLNCVVQYLAWLYAYLYQRQQQGLSASSDDAEEFFSEHAMLEICGDDSRVNCMTPHALEVLDAANGWAAWLEVWRTALPWEIKVEGQVVFAHKWISGVGPEFELPFERRAPLFPPLVARCLFVTDGLLWAPLFNSARCLRKLTSQGTDPAFPQGRSVEDDAELRLAAFCTLALHTVWHEDGIIWNPDVAMLLANGWYTPTIQRIVKSIYAKVYSYGLIMNRIEC